MTNTQCLECLVQNSCSNNAKTKSNRRCLTRACLILPELFQHRLNNGQGSWGSQIFFFASERLFDQMRLQVGAQNGGGAGSFPRTELGVSGLHSFGIFSEIENADAMHPARVVSTQKAYGLFQAQVVFLNQYPAED